MKVMCKLDLLYKATIDQTFIDLSFFSFICGLVVC